MNAVVPKIKNDLMFGTAYVREIANVQFNKRANFCNNLKNIFYYLLDANLICVLIKGKLEINGFESLSIRKDAVK